MLHIFSNNLSGFWSNLVFRWFRLELPMFFYCDLGDRLLCQEAEH